MRISDWSSDVCSSDLLEARETRPEEGEAEAEGTGRIFGADFIAVDRFGIELERADQSLRAADRREGQDRRFQRRPVEVEAARLIAANSSHRSEENTSDPQSLMRISYAVFVLNK